MALTPKERSDFDGIVEQLRHEDAGIGMIEPKRHRMALLVSVLVAVLVFGFGVALASHSPDAFGALMVASIVLGSMAAAWRICIRSRSN